MSESEKDKGSNLEPSPSPAPHVGRGWLPIASAPKDGTLLLLATNNVMQPYIGRWHEDRHGGWWEKVSGWDVVPDWWQPLPSPPTEGR